MSEREDIRGKLKDKNAIMKGGTKKICGITRTGGKEKEQEERKRNKKSLGKNRRNIEGGGRMKKLVLQIKSKHSYHWKLPTNIETANIRGWEMFNGTSFIVGQDYRGGDRQSRKKKTAKM